MVFLKVYRAGALIGVETAEDPAWVRWQEKNDMLIRCTAEEAEGIISERDNNTIYPLGSGIHGVETDLSAVIVNQAEYEEARGQAGELPDPEDETPDDPEGDITSILTRAELTALVRSQAEEIEALQEVNDMLTECLLEMSEVVYGE